MKTIENILLVVILICAAASVISILLVIWLPFEESLWAFKTLMTSIVVAGSSLAALVLCLQ